MIWFLIDALAQPEHYAVTFRRNGKTPEFTLAPIDWLPPGTKVKGR